MKKKIKIWYKIELQIEQKFKEFYKQFSYMFCQDLFFQTNKPTLATSSL